MIKTITKIILAVGLLVLMLSFVDAYTTIFSWWDVFAEFDFFTKINPIIYVLNTLFNIYFFDNDYNNIVNYNNYGKII